VPHGSGLALLALAVWLFVVAGAARPARAEGGRFKARAAPTEPAPSRARWSPVVLAVALVLYAALLPRLGFVVASFALVVVASRLMGAPGWWRPALLALSVTGVGYLLFARWLGVPLP